MSDDILRLVADEIGLEDVRIHKIIPSTQSIVYIFSDIHASSTKFILKAFTRKYSHNSFEAVRKEFISLAKFHSALDNKAISFAACPKPIRLFPEEWAYLMEYVEGSSLDAILSKKQIALWTVLSGRIIKGLKIFHNNVNSIYGDFQPANILVKTDLQVIFIDPTIPNPQYEILADKYDPLAVDVGYWVFTVAAGTLKSIVFSISRQVTLLQFSRQMAEKAREMSSTETLLADIERVAQFHFERILGKSQIKGHFLFLPFLCATKYMLQVKDL